MKRFPAELAMGFLMIAAGCARYHPAPIQPAQVQQDFLARSFSDPGLRAYMRASLPPGTVSPHPSRQDLYSLTLTAFYYNPEIDIARGRLQAARAAIITAGGRPNPLVEAGGGYSTLRESPYLIRFLLGIPVRTAGKRGHQIVRARRLAEAARIDMAETAWRIRSRVRSAFLDYMITLRLHERYAMRRQALRSEMAVLMDQRLAVGEASGPDAENARAARESADAAVRAAEGEITRSRLALAVALGLPAGALDGATLAWPDLDSPPTEGVIPPVEVQRTGLLERPDVLRSLAEYDASEAQLQLEVARQYPDLQLSPGYSFDDAVNKYTFILSLALPILNRNQGPIAEAEALRKEAAARCVAIQANAVHEMEGAAAEYGIALRELSAAENALADRRQRARASGRAWKIGEVDRAAYLGAQLEEAAGEGARLSALARTQDAFGMLEDAVRRPLPPEMPLPPLPGTGPSDRIAAGRER